MFIIRSVVSSYKKGQAVIHIALFSSPEIRIMSSPRPKSPRTPVLPKKEDKEESFWDKIGTIGRKKRIKEGMFNVIV